MDGFASRGRQQHPFDLLFLVASLAMIAWVVVPR
jgi:hypothetical protein